MRILQKILWQIVPLILAVILIALTIAGFIVDDKLTYLQIRVIGLILSFSSVIYILVLFFIDDCIFDRFRDKDHADVYDKPNNKSKQHNN